MEGVRERRRLPAQVSRCGQSIKFVHGRLAKSSTLAKWKKATFSKKDQGLVAVCDGSKIHLG